MAGEWLKFEANTPEKQEVFEITVAMGWSDPDLTVGKLLKIWRWFDQQTIDGNAPRVTFALLDHVSGVSGFAQAMCNVGWLMQKEGGICLPNFERHNGKTAKDRCLTAKRVAKHKSNDKTNAEGNGASVTNALPREEKRREEKKDKPKPFSSSGDDGATPKPFDRFWEAYPRRVGKNAAQKAWAKLKPSAELLETILAAIAAQQAGADWLRDDGEYIPHPASWLNGGRWLDEVREYIAPAPKVGAWWATKETMMAFALTLSPPLQPLSGEYPHAFKERINTALENAGKPIQPAPSRTPYTPPIPARDVGGESALTPEQLAARRSEMLAAAGSRKSAAAGAT